MTTHRLAAASVAFAALVAGIVVLGAPEPAPAALGLAGVVALGAALAAGVPGVVPVAFGALVGAYTVGAAGSDPLVRPDVLVVAPLLWLAHEVAMRSFDLRGDVGSGGEVVRAWAGRVLLTAGAVTAFAALVIALVQATPPGGITAWVFAMVAAVATVGLLALISETRAGRRARG